MASLSCETFMVVVRVEAYRIHEVGPFIVYGIQRGFEAIGRSIFQ